MGKALRDELESFKNQEICNGLCQFLPQKRILPEFVASPIYINPVGDMDFKGLSAELNVFKDFRKNRSKMEVIRHGKYKSARTFSKMK
jgi:protease-4